MREFPVDKTAHGEGYVKRFSDTGSTPVGSTTQAPPQGGAFLCGGIDLGAEIARCLHRIGFTYPTRSSESSLSRRRGWVYSQSETARHRHKAVLFCAVEPTLELKSLGVYTESGSHTPLEVRKARFPDAEGGYIRKAKLPVERTFIYRRECFNYVCLWQMTFTASKTFATQLIRNFEWQL